MLDSCQHYLIRQEIFPSLINKLLPAGCFYIILELPVTLFKFTRIHYLHNIAHMEIGMFIKILYGKTLKSCIRPRYISTYIYNFSRDISKLKETNPMSRTE